MGLTLQEIQAQIVPQLQTTSDTAALDAQVLLAHVLQKPRSWVIAHPEYIISDEQYQKIFSALGRLEHGEPLPYVIGHWEFYGLDFRVTPDVLIPRPETELLVERAIGWLQLNPHKRRVIDVGTGSGCIGIAIAIHIPDVQLLMTDISKPALEVTRQNLERHGLAEKVVLRRSDLLSRVKDPFSMDLICANLPYIPADTVDSLPVAKNEPRLALDGGPRGLKLIRRLLKEAKGVLDSGGLMLLEIDPSQSKSIKYLAQQDFPNAKIRILKDLSGRKRCLEVEMNLTIFHLCQRADWLRAQQNGKYRAESLMADGFIHCSINRQLVDVANRYYQGMPDMVILAIDPEKLDSEIRWEKSGGVFYPHIYGPINLEAIVSACDIRPEEDGVYRQINILTE
jgi:release factor glutamine methyltransferase